MDVQARTTLPASVDTPAAARAFARAAAEGAPVRIDDLTLVVSELVTNAVLHGDGDITLRVVGTGGGGVRVEVGDDNPEGATLPADATPSDEAGRGLLLVSRLATRWGVRPVARGKVVWAELAG